MDFSGKPVIDVINSWNYVMVLRLKNSNFVSELSQNSKQLIQYGYIMAVLKVIEIMASSPKSWEDATIIAVKAAGETLKGIRYPSKA